MQKHTNDHQTSVSVIVPCRNEQDFIGNCLESLISQNYPESKLEILVVDGVSNGRTKEIISEYAEEYPFIKLLNNVKKVVPSALNIGIKAARGDIIVRIDVHCTYSQDYITKCVKYLQEYDDVDNVGGICITLPGNDTVLAQAIALAISHPFGVGNSYFRIGCKKERYVDTVPFGCFRRDVFLKVGLFDEDLTRTQDAEFNARLIKNGGRVLLVPEIVSYYYSRNSLRTLWEMQFQYGYFKPLAAKKIGRILALRQLAPPIFVGSLFVSLICALFSKISLCYFVFVLSLYILTACGVSLRIFLKRTSICCFYLPVVFSVIHFGWGLGCLKGIWDFIILRRDKKKKTRDMPLTR